MTTQTNQPPRKVSVWMYLGAFVISLLIFAVGMFAGKMIDNAKISELQDELNSVSRKLESMQLLIMSENASNSNFCPVYATQLTELDSDIEKFGYKLTFLEDVQHVTDTDLKRKYFALEGEAYLLSQKNKAVCNDSSVLLINFYSNRENACSDCRKEGDEVLKARDSLASRGIKVKLFSFDGDLGSPIALAFKTQYGVRTYPSLVIDEKTYSGYRDSSEIERLVIQSKTPQN